MSGELELGGSLTPKNPLFGYQPFCDEPLDALLPEDHPLCRTAACVLSNWPIHRFAHYQRSFMLNERLLQSVPSIGLHTPKKVAAAGDQFLVALVAAGQSVVLLPSVSGPGSGTAGVVRLKLIAPHYLRWDIAFYLARRGFLICRGQPKPGWSCCASGRLLRQCLDQVLQPGLGVFFGVNGDAGVQAQHELHLAQPQLCEQLTDLLAAAAESVAITFITQGRSRRRGSHARRPAADHGSRSTTASGCRAARPCPWSR